MTNIDLTLGPHAHFRRFKLKAALSRRHEARRFELRSRFGADVGEPRRDVREPLFQSQEWRLQPFKSSSKQECNRKPAKLRERPAVIVRVIVMTGESVIRELLAQEMIRVQTVGDVTEIDEPRILQERGPLARSSEEGEEDCDTSDRHKGIPDHAAGQRWYGIKQLAELANNDPRRASQ